MYPRRPKVTLSRYFAGLTESTFQARLGIADPPLVDYIADLLVRFVRLESIHKVRDLGGRRLSEIGAMLVEAEQRLGNAQREVHRHIGDFTLFWTGVYPESLRKVKAQLDQFVDYCQQGKRSYYLASTFDGDEYASENEVLERLSEQFELCAYGLREVRREWEARRGDEQIGPIIVE